MKWETKNANLTGHVIDVDTTGNRVKLRAASFETLDSYNDVIHQKSFKKTISENFPRIKHLREHDIKMLIGKPVEMVESSEGLDVVSDIAPTALGKETLTLIEGGYLTENSIGYQVVKATRDETKGIRHIQEVKLWEYSSVGVGANEYAINLKSIHPKDQLKELFVKMEVLQKHLHTGNISDETCQLMEIQLLQVKSCIEDLLEKSLTIVEPEIISTPELVVEPVEVKNQYIPLAEFYKAYKN